MYKKKSLFITFEGIEGSGKTYQIKKLYDIGANIGVTCIPAVNRGYVKQAIAVEPESENF